MRKYIIGILTVVVVIGGLAGLSIYNKQKNMFLPVKAAAVAKGDIQAYLSTTGVVKSQNSKEYYGPQAKVSSVKVKVGDEVSKGDILVTYELQDFQTPVDQARIQYNSAILQKQELVNQNNQLKGKIKEKNTQIAKVFDDISEINREIDIIMQNNDPAASSKIQTLNQQKGALEQKKETLIQQRDAIQPISKEKLTQADNSIKTAKLGLESAEKNRSKAVNSIVATDDGVVTAINAVVGAMGTPNQPTVVVQDLDNLKVLLAVGKFDAENIKLDQTAVVRNRNTEYQGEVAFIAPTAEKPMNNPTGDTTLEVAVNIVDEKPELKLEFEVDTDILLSEAKGVIKVPAESIKTDKTGKSFVYVIKDKKAVAKEVKLGLQSDTEAQILEGVEVGERVILNPTEAIKDGSPVKESDDLKRGGFMN